MNKVSPFFAIEAEQMILAELYDNAIELCKTGLEEYPEYITAWTILARAYTKQGKFDDANEVIKQSKSYHSANRMIKFLEKEILDNVSLNNVPEMNIVDDSQKLDSSQSDNTGKEFNKEKGFLANFISSREVLTSSASINTIYGLEVVLHKSFVSGQMERQSFRDIFIPDIVEIRTPTEELIMKTDSSIIEESISPFDNKLADLARKLDEVSVSRIYDTDKETLIKDNSSQKTIITETMANIYIQQGAIEEAIKAFKELSKLYPEKKEYFKSKIKTLSSKTKK